MEKSITRKEAEGKNTTTDQPIRERKSVNSTGIPNAIKTGAESLSGLSLDDVRVHYNSAKPSRINALAYTQGTDIHVAPGQEAYLPHEAWHVVQQKQGRVAPTMQLQGLGVNTDSDLEQEADHMGDKILQAKMKEGMSLSERQCTEGTVQMASNSEGIMPRHDITRAKFEGEKRGLTYSRMDLTYHHIIPEGILKKVFAEYLQPVYLFCRQKPGVQGADELVKAVDKLIDIGRAFRANTRKNDKEKLGKEGSLSGDFDFSEDVNVDTGQGVDKEKAEKAAEEERESRKISLNGDFGGAVRWIPGNVHQGPSKRTHVASKSYLKTDAKFHELYQDGKGYDKKFLQEHPEFLTADGGEGFEYAAVNAVGEERMMQLGQLQSNLFQLSHYKDISTIISKDVELTVKQQERLAELIDKVKVIITTISSLYYKDPKKTQFIIPEMNPDQWEKVEGKDEWQLTTDKVQIGPGETKYRKVEGIVSQMSRFEREMSEMEPFKGKREVDIRSETLESDDVMCLVDYVENTALYFNNMGMIDVIERWRKMYDKTGYMKLMQDFMKVAKEFLQQYRKSMKFATQNVMPTIVYEPMNEKFLAFKSFFGR